MATTSTNFIGVLGAGSGIDIKALAQGLVDAEKAPKAEIIQKRITQSETRISGYSTVAYAVGQVKAALDALKNPSDFNLFTASSSQSSAVAAKVTGSATLATHEVSVQQLAQGQRSISGSLAAGQALNGNPASSFTVQLTIAGTASAPITVSTPTPEGLVSAINTANLDVKASLVNTGSGASAWRIVLQGKTGEANSFSLTSTSAVDLGFSFAAPGSTTLPNRVAQDAKLNVNGIAVSRSTNQISDVIDGVTLDLLNTTTSAATVALSRDTAPIKDKIKTLVTNYNDLQSIIDAALDKDSAVEKLGGSLVGDSVGRSIRSMVKQIVMPDVASVQANGALTNLRQLGLFIDSDNKMKFASLKESAAPGESLLNVGDESVLDKALAQRFADVAAFFGGSSGSIGKAREMSDRLAGTGAYTDSSARPSSPIRLLTVQQRNANDRITADKERLAALDERMSQLLTKYTEQFAVMESIVGSSKSTRTGIENSFKGMSASR
jgi:flagellar hook-associated protein 2